MDVLFQLVGVGGSATKRAALVPDSSKFVRDVQRFPRDGRRAQTRDGWPERCRRAGRCSNIAEVARCVRAPLGMRGTRRATLPSAGKACYSPESIPLRELVHPFLGPLDR